jgi:predicted flap endonuclease-1-like 5' DNA nuclease
MLEIVMPKNYVNVVAGVISLVFERLGAIRQEMQRPMSEPVVEVATAVAEPPMVKPVVEVATAVAEPPMVEPVVEVVTAVAEPPMVEPVVEVVTAVAEPPMVEPVVEVATAVAPAMSDDLTRIKGIGPTFARRLRDAGLDSYAKLAAATPAEVKEAAKLAEWQGNPAEWVIAAGVLAAEG